jgi:hypothetical protein
VLELKRLALDAAREEISRAEKISKAVLIKRIKDGGAAEAKLRNMVNKRAIEKFVGSAKKIEGKPSDDEDDGDLEPMVWLTSKVYRNTAFKKGAAMDDTIKGPSETEIPSTAENMPRAIAEMKRLKYEYHPLRWRMSLPTGGVAAATIKLPEITVSSRNAEGKQLFDKAGLPITKQITDYWHCPGKMLVDGTPMQSLVVCQAIAQISVSKQGMRIKWPISSEVIIRRRVPQSKSLISDMSFAEPLGLEDGDGQVAIVNHLAEKTETDGGGAGDKFVSDVDEEFGGGDDENGGDDDENGGAGEDTANVPEDGEVLGDDTAPEEPIKEAPKVGGKRGAPAAAAVAQAKKPKKESVPAPVVEEETTAFEEEAPPAGDDEAEGGDDEKAGEEAGGAADDEFVDTE